MTSLIAEMRYRAREDLAHGALLLAQCGKQFGEEGFHEREGKPYCRDDYFDMFAPKCGACNRAIMENYISALNAQWHPDCFVCRVSIIGGGRERGATGR